MTSGAVKPDRTGTGTRSVFGHQLRYDLTRGFPLVTTKKVHFRSVAYELLWFLRGDSNVRWLQEHGVTIWDEWAGPDGDLGPVYGVQWRSWPAPDGAHGAPNSQLGETLRPHPSSPGVVGSAWDAAEDPPSAPPPRHPAFPFLVGPGALGS